MQQSLCVHAYRDGVAHFADKVLLGKHPARDFNRLPFPDAPKPYSWSATHPGKTPVTAPTARADGGH